MLERLLRHEADVAVMAKSVSDPRLHAVRLRTDRLVLFAPARPSRWPRRGRAPLAALAGQELVLRERGSITREVLEQAMAAADIQPGAIVEVQTREGVREAVAAGFGIGAVFASELGEDRASAASSSPTPISPSPNMPSACRSAAASRWCGPSWTKRRDSRPGARNKTVKKLSSLGRRGVGFRDHAWRRDHPERRSAASPCCCGACAWSAPGLTRAFGAALRRAIAACSRNRFTAFAGGLAITGLLQSSTATALLLSSFAGRGLIPLSIALAVMLGADVGTTIAAQVLSFDLGWLSPLLIGAGVIAFLSSEPDKPRHLGRVAIGLGLMLLSLKLLALATAAAAQRAGLHGRCCRACRTSMSSPSLVGDARHLVRAFQPVDRAAGDVVCRQRHRSSPGWRWRW